MAGMKKPRSNSLGEYRLEISRYLLKVRDVTGFKNAALGDMAGVVHTTIGRAIKMSNTMDYTNLLAISDKSGVPIPPSLEQAAKRHKEGVADRADLSAHAQAIMEDVRNADPATLEQIAELLRRKTA